MITKFERRRTDRVKVMLSATVEQGGEATPSRLANLSADGALVIGPALSERDPVLLQRNGTDVRGSVTWSVTIKAVSALKGPWTSNPRSERSRGRPARRRRGPGGPA